MYQIIFFRHGDDSILTRTMEIQVTRLTSNAPQR